MNDSDLADEIKRQITEKEAAIHSKSYRAQEPPYKAKLMPNGSYAPAEEPVKPKIICMEDIEATPTEWLWHPYIPLGKLTLMQGDPGHGKTMLALMIAAIISRGEQFLNDNPFEKRDPGVVIYQTAEDGLNDTIKPRLLKMNPNLKNIFVIDENEKSLTLLDTRIEEVMRERNPRLMFIDPLQAYLGASVDMHRANEVRPVLAKLGRLSEKHRCAIVMVMHMSKMTTAKALYRGLGSIDIPAVARSILVIGKNPDNPEQKIMAHEKSSLALNGESIAFRIDSSEGIVFEGFSDLKADDIINVASKKGDKQSVSLDEAKKFLLEAIGENGYIKKQDLFRLASEKGIKERTLYNAKDALCIKGHNIGFGKSKISWWTLEGAMPPEPLKVIEFKKDDPP